MALQDTVVMPVVSPFQFQMGKETECRHEKAVGDPFIVTPGETVLAKVASKSNQAPKKGTVRPWATETASGPNFPNR